MIRPLRKRPFCWSFKRQYVDRILMCFYVHCGSVLRSPPLTTST